MGRRSLRKIDPDLDLSRHLKPLETLPRPLDPDTLFRERAELEIEVGSGKGMFVDSVSQARPDRNYLGNEVSRKYARFAAARLARTDRPNAVIVQGDGLELFRELLPPACAAGVHVYFPDPWWKKRHRKRRVMTDSFLRDVERVLAPGGILHFWTDVCEYFDATLVLIGEATSLSGPRQVPEPPARHDMDYRTHFERRMRMDGRAVYRAEFLKEQSWQNDELAE